MPSDGDEDALLRTLTRVANVLDNTSIRFAISGGLAVYARGGPFSEHDVDVLVKQADVEPAARALVEAGMRRSEPPEDWLTKVYDGDSLVDIIFRPNQRVVTDEMLDRADFIRVSSTAVPVVAGTELMVDKLLVLGPHRCDFTPLLSIARALREQVDWDEVAEVTAESPYARAFLRLLCDLGIIGWQPSSTPCEGVR